MVNSKCLQEYICEMRQYAFDNYKSIRLLSVSIQLFDKLSKDFAVPKDDVAPDVGGEGWRIALGQHIQDLAALFTLPSPAFQNACTHDDLPLSPFEKARVVPTESLLPAQGLERQPVSLVHTLSSLD